MLKVYVKLKATKDMPRGGWKKGDTLEMENDVFDKQSGFAFEPLDIEWEIVAMEVRGYNPVIKCNDIIREAVYHCCFGELMNRFEGNDDAATAEIEFRLNEFFKHKYPHSLPKL